MATLSATVMTVLLRGDDDGVAGRRVGDDGRRDPEDGLDDVRGDDLGGRPLGDDLAVAHRDEVVGVAGGHREVVQHHDDGRALVVALRSRTRSSTSIWWAMSRNDVGSSSSSTGVAWARTIASHTRCRWPPERLSTGTPREVHEVGALERRGDDRLVGSRAHCLNSPWCGWRPRSTSSSTLTPSGTIGCCGSRPRRRATSRVGSDPISSPSSRTEPPRGCSSRAEPAQQRRLAAAVGADDDGDAPGRHVEVEAVDDDAVVVGRGSGVRGGDGPEASAASAVIGGRGWRLGHGHRPSGSGRERSIQSRTGAPSEAGDDADGQAVPGMA